MKNHVEIIEKLWKLVETVDENNEDHVRELLFEYEVDSWTKLIPELESRLKSMFELQNMMEDLNTPFEQIDKIGEMICMIKSEFITIGHIYLSDQQREYIYSI